MTREGAEHEPGKLDAVQLCEANSNLSTLGCQEHSGSVACMDASSGGVSLCKSRVEELTALVSEPAREWHGILEHAAFSTVCQALD